MSSSRWHGCAVPPPAVRGIGAKRGGGAILVRDLRYCWPPYLCACVCVSRLDSRVSHRTVSQILNGV